MHLILPFASVLAEDAQRVLDRLALTHLPALLASLEPEPPDAGDEASLSMPHERALAQSLGLEGVDGALPWAAHAMAAQRLDPGDAAWGRVTPLHWSVANHGVVAHGPAALALDAAESRALHAALAPLFEGDGAPLLQGGAAGVWFVSHESLAAQPCASLDRVIGRTVEPWLAPLAPRWRRLQNEAQMLLHGHPVNEVRAERGLPEVNSFWLDGCGRRQAVRADASDVSVEPALREPALAGDWPAWIAAWQRLDAELFGPWVERVRGGAAFALSLCGERRAQRWRSPARRGWLAGKLGFLRRPPALAPLLAAL